MLFTATPRTFEGGKSGFGTCAAMVIDATERIALVPLQCVDEAIACNLAVLRADQAWPAEVRGPSWNETAPPIGSDLWSIGFPEQIPSFLSAIARKR